jgi:ribonucleoside-diphosphate reductase alpha chain
MEPVSSSVINKSVYSFDTSNIEGKIASSLTKFSVKKVDGSVEAFNLDRICQTLSWACAGYEQAISNNLIIEELARNVFNGIPKHELADALILATIAFIEQDPGYGYVAARLLFRKLFKQVTNKSVLHSDVDHEYSQAFINGIVAGVESKVFAPELLDFDLERLAFSLVPERDHLFDYMGIRTLQERYFARKGNKLFELPQAFWMRVAMGLAIREEDKTSKAIEFYNMMSLLRYVPSTPTLLHSGLTRPQLSSCFLGTVGDDLTNIFKSIGDHAQLSKWSGGVAYDWSNIRATGSMIESIRTESQGVVPFLKIANDTTAAINRSGKRRSAYVAYLETWHMEIEDFLDLRKNTGDERRRTHDINTANWVPDLFMKRVMDDGQWTLFSPEEVEDLHHLYGKKFEERYEYYEQQARNGQMKLHKVVVAKDLWRKMLGKLFETGHPWITFKDPSNVRSPQDHAGVVHSSNLCTEITLNTSQDEVAVCNLGSVNLSRHVINGVFDYKALAQTVEVAMRMLDNVVDINFYPVKEAENSNLRHRPVGLGVMGFQDALYKLNVNFEDKKTLGLADEIMEHISYNAILSSSKLAKERGEYQSYKGSKWDRNIFPQDTIDLLEQERGMSINVARGGKLDWTPVRDHVKKHGMRNSNTMAIAPTATISNIAGSFPSIEPIYKNIYVKANMSGEFTVVNKYLINDLKGLGLWNQDMLDQIKYYDGNLDMISTIPVELKNKYKEAFEIDPLWLVELNAARGKWIDQSQSFNVFMKGLSGKKLSEIYFAGWQAGFKSFYYLRALGATQIEKSTLDAKKFGFTQKREYNSVTESAPEKDESVSVAQPAACSLSMDPDCEACQ